MKLIAKQQGGDTDTSHDHEYTDWDDLTRFVEEFVAAFQFAWKRPYRLYQRLVDTVNEQSAT
jgi:hypothetical protein